MSDVRDNTQTQRFELTAGEHTVFAAYERQDGMLFINYVEAPPALRGTGAAGRLMEGIAALARKEQSKITPICGYAAAWFRRHPEHTDLLISGK